MKVLNGMSEVAGQGIYTVQGLIANGVPANMAVWSRNTNGYETDIDLRIDKKNKIAFPFYAIKMLIFALKAGFKYDVFHSHAGYSLLPFNIDVGILKLFKRRIFAEFHGSEIRNLFIKYKYEYFNADWENIRMKQKQQKRVARLLKSTTGVIIHDYELLPHIPDDCSLPVYIVPLRLDLSKFHSKYPDPSVRKVKIVHAPSKRSTKGTEQILKRLKLVSSEYELILVENKTQEEAFKIYQDADIIIDQISVGTYGVFAIEAMALGKPVITYINPEIQKSFPADLPIISDDFDSLPEIVEKLIANGELRNSLGKQGRRYVERYHDNRKVTHYLKNIYCGDAEEHDLFKVL